MYLMSIETRKMNSFFQIINSSINSNILKVYNRGFKVILETLI